jgi:hypothetical protein
MDDWPPEGLLRLKLLERRKTDICYGSVVSYLSSKPRNNEKHTPEELRGAPLYKLIDKVRESYKEFSGWNEVGARVMASKFFGKHACRDVFSWTPGDESNIEATTETRAVIIRAVELYY